MDNISTHFTWKDVTASETAKKLGWVNELPEILHDIAIAQAMLLENVRSVLNVPLSVSSWYRCPALNSRVGGKPNSAHLTARATDVVPIGLDIIEAYNMVAKAGVMEDIDQLILENDKNGNRWLHIAQHPHGDEPRHMAFKLQKDEVTRVNS